MLKALTVAALAALTVACTNEPWLSVDVQGSSFERVRVAASTLELATIPFDVTNDGDATAFIAACGDRIAASVDRRVNGRWEQFAGGICFADRLVVPLELRAGARQHADLGVGEAGQYRIKVHYTEDASGRKPRSAVSEAFDVR